MRMNQVKATASQAKEPLWLAEHAATLPKPIYPVLRRNQTRLSKSPATRGEATAQRPASSVFEQQSSF
jgi:hypothetical protein